MALTATIYHLTITLSDVDRGVYETLDLRVARHPSESMRYLTTRVLAYALCYDPGIAFSKAGLSAAEQPPVSIHDPTGILLAWIDVGAPAAERLHKAAKAAKRVAVFTHVELALLRKEAATKAIHRIESIEIWRFAAKFLDELEASVDRNTKLEIVHTDGNLYITVALPGGATRTIEGVIERTSLVEP